MRGIILILILLVVAAIAALATGLINLDVVRPAAAPKVEVTGNGITARGGQAPAIRVETGKVQVKPPEIQVTPRRDETQPATAPAANQAAPAQPPVATTDSTQR
ncbi:hypothetical protein GCM10022280_00490 [Sphingomonas swuensis]|uniref:Uncharacterized protein n=1 Tax=Sphingomonas swuensis TaxID=977800 RepID=A0ABP7S7Y6_9SPHN